METFGTKFISDTFIIKSQSIIMLKDKNVLFAEVWTGLVHWTKDRETGKFLTENFIHTGF